MKNTKCFKILFIILFFLCFSPKLVNADVGIESCGADGLTNCAPNQRCDRSQTPPVCIDYQTWINITANQYAENINSDAQTNNPSLDSMTLRSLDSIAYGLATQSIGDLSHSNQSNPSVNRGALGYISTGITTLINNPPASSITYLADIGQNIGIAKPAYAQGIGFAGLNPILFIWKAFRNLAYLAFILIFVIYGFMIMFRVKIDPRTVVSFQSALPKIVISLILVTFSYAIVGLLIDLSYLLIFVSISFFQTANLIDSTGATQIQNVVFNENIFKVILNNFPLFIGQAAGAVGALVENFTGNLPIIGGTTNALAILIFAIAILFVMFKLFFALLTSYIGIIMDTIFAPLKLLFDVLPGQNGFQGWILGLLANILVFPATVFMLILAAVLMGKNGSNPWGVVNPGYSGQNTGWVPPLLGMQSGGATQYVPSLIGLGILFILPKIVDMIKEMFGQKGQSPISNAFGEGVKPGVGFISSFAGSYIGGHMEENRQVNALKKVLPTPGAMQNIKMGENG
jgi:hypothetical protein